MSIHWVPSPLWQVFYIFSPQNIPVKYYLLSQMKGVVEKDMHKAAQSAGN